MERLAIFFIVVINLSHVVRFAGATFLVVDPQSDLKQQYSYFLLLDILLSYLALFIEYFYTYDLITLKAFLHSNTFKESQVAVRAEKIERNLVLTLNFLVFVVEYLIVFRAQYFQIYAQSAGEPAFILFSVLRSLRIIMDTYLSYLFVVAFAFMIQKKESKLKLFFRVFPKRYRYLKRWCIFIVTTEFIMKFLHFTVGFYNIEDIKIDSDQYLAMNGIMNIVGPLVRTLVALTILYFFYRQSMYNLKLTR